MDAHVRPADEAELVDAVQGLAAAGTPAEVVGAGTKRGYGRPVNAAATLDLGGLAGIRAYEPDELTLTCGAGTPLAEVAAALAERGQELAFEPPDLGPLYGAPPGGATVGGVIACNLSGPRRVAAGAARDHFLGFRAVSGRGERFKAGGHVVKNVSGYDLCKLLAGSFGTVAALAEVTVKVLPRAPHAETLLVPGLAPAEASALLVRASRTPLEPSGLACVPEGPVAAALGLPRDAGATAAVRFEGPRGSVDERTGRMADEAGRPSSRLGPEATAALWKGIADALPFAGPGDAEARRPLWRVSAPPAAAAGVADRLACRWLLDGGGVVWLAPEGGAEPDAVRAAAARAGGHAVLVRASDAERASTGVFPEPPPGAARIARRIREGFDPRGVLNPGRMGPA